MPFFVYGGYYEKDKALEKLRNLKYYNSKLEEIKSAEEMTQGMGIIPYMRIASEKMEEDFLVEKMLTIKGILETKLPNESIDKYLKLTSPDESHFMYPIKKMFERFQGDGFGEIIDQIATPMCKEEFEHYLDIYNTLLIK